MKPQGNGLVTLHDDKRKERGFNCMKLIEFLTEDDEVTDWEHWHEAHIHAASGQCPYSGKCHIHARSTKKNPDKHARQLTINFE